jgi:hypothetical protein
MDYYRLFEKMDSLLQERAVTAYAYLEWHQKRARLRRARDQWQRLRVFRESLEYQGHRVTIETAESNAPRRVTATTASKLRGAKESIKRVAVTPRTRLGMNSSDQVTSAGSVINVNLPDIKIYPGTWERKTLLNAV